MTYIRSAIVLFSGLGLLGGFGCASGPHPAVVMASKDFECPEKSLTRHEIYPNKQRIEGCGKEAIYIKGCTEYGAAGKCDWAKAPSEP